MRNLLLALACGLMVGRDSRMHDSGLFRRPGATHPRVDVHVRGPADVLGRMGTDLVLGPAGPYIALSDARRHHLIVRRRPGKLTPAGANRYTDGSFPLARSLLRGATADRHAC